MKMKRRKHITFIKPLTDMISAVIYLRRLGNDFIAFKGLKTRRVRMNRTLTALTFSLVRKNSDIPNMTMRKSKAFQLLLK